MIKIINQEDYNNKLSLASNKINKQQIYKI